MGCGDPLCAPAISRDPNGGGGPASGGDPNVGGDTADCNGLMGRNDPMDPSGFTGRLVLPAVGIHGAIHTDSEIIRIVEKMCALNLLAVWLCDYPGVLKKWFPATTSRK